MESTNNNIKIVRLQSGEDIIANYFEDDETEAVMLDNPMHIIFKRMPTGQTIMMMLPWLPIEIIKQNNAIIYQQDILTIIDPKEELIEYYGNIIIHAQERMDNFPSLFNDEDDDDEESEESEELSKEEIFELLEERKHRKLH